jgi:hypothetical protein
MFAFLGVGPVEIVVLGAIAAIVGIVIMFMLLNRSAGSRGPGDEVRHLRVEVDRLREENEHLRDEVKRLRDQGGASADTGIKRT